jgi:hypothetical protein
MKFIKRNVCVITGAKDLEHLYMFKNFPVLMGSTESDKRDDLFYDMSWTISKSSGVIQLNKLLPLNIIYRDPHGSGVIGSVWNNHHKCFANFIYKYNPDSVFEIGGSHGIMSYEYSKIKEISWTILDPNPSPIPECKSKYIKGFFDENFKSSESFDMVVHSHLFEHIYDPNKFMNHLANFIGDGKKMLFSIPNLESMMRKKYTNSINFEHTIFLTEPYIDYLLTKHKFRIIEKIYYLDNSIFYATVKDKTVDIQELPSGLYEKNKALYNDYISYHKNLISEINNKMLTTQQSIYLFGAHIFSQYLIMFGLDTKRINSILDNDQAKQDRRLYGTSLLVHSPKILKNETSPIVILKAGVFNEEIKNDILNKINANTIFWE